MAGCFPVSLPQPSEKAELLQDRKALTLHRGREGDYCSPLRGDGVEWGLGGRSPGAGPSACRLLPAPLPPPAEPHRPGGAGARGLPRGHRSLPGTGTLGEAEPPFPAGSRRGTAGRARMFSPNPAETAELAVLLRVAPCFKDASSLSFFPFPQPKHAVKLPLTCTSYQI